MPKKLNSLFLMNDTINLMKSLLENSRKTGKEHGFDLCVNPRDRILKGENPCSGNRCDVNLLGKCEQDEILVGIYHTHPYPFSSRPSMQDLDIGLKYDINCIGTVKENNITCYVKKDNIPFEEVKKIRNKFLILARKQEEGSLTKENVKEMFKLENTVRKKYFHKFNII